MFRNAAKFQKNKEGQNCVSVVVLDEVGLAEDSPSLPLKTLHPLLEDGTTKSSDVRRIYEAMWSFKNSTLQFVY